MATTVANAPLALPATAPVPATDVSVVSAVSEICASALLLGVQLRSAHEFDDVDATQRQIMALLDRTETQACALGLTTTDAMDVAFALVAAVDEAVTLSPWEDKSVWIARPIQFLRYGRYDAGEEFFARLDRLRQERPLRADVLHVYYLCLALGFKGRYQVRPESERRELIASVAAQLRRGDPGDRPPLAPRGVPGEEIAEAVREIPVWVVAVLAAAGACALYLVLTAHVTWRVGEVGRLIGQH